MSGAERGRAEREAGHAGTAPNRCWWLQPRPVRPKRREEKMRRGAVAIPPMEDCRLQLVSRGRLTLAFCLKELEVAQLNAEYRNHAPVFLH